MHSELLELKAQLWKRLVLDKGDGRTFAPHAYEIEPFGTSHHL